MQPTWGRRLVGLDGLRGIAATSVLIHHVVLYMGDQSGQGVLYTLAALLGHGLTLFFVLSGFLLYRPFASALIGESAPPALGRYFRNRGLRIFPAYLLILAATWALGVAVTDSYSSGHRDPGGFPDPLTAIADLSMLQTFFPPTVLTGIGVAWSLTTELSYYLMLPVFFSAARWLVRRGLNRYAAAIAPAALLALVAYACKAIGAAAKTGLSATESYDFSWGTTWTAVLERSILVQGDLFAYGMLAAVAVILLHQRGIGRTRVSVRAGLVSAFVLMAGASVILSSDYSKSMVGTGAAALILAAVLPDGSGRPNMLARILEFRPVWYVGLVSYSVYLWHTPVIYWLQERGLYNDSPAGLLVSCALVLVLTLGLSTATYFAVERPALRLKARAQTKRPVAS
jgi:peptidoglycan/LPS O-acetylase OafA/YrhL